VTRQEDTKKDLELIVRDTCKDIRLYTNRNIEDFITECVSTIQDYLHSKGLGFRGNSLGVSHPHLRNYFTFEPLIEEPDESPAPDLHDTFPVEPTGDITWWTRGPDSVTDE